MSRKERSAIQHRVLEELEWDPSVDATTIGVTVAEGGVVALTGHVPSYSDRWTAERVARRVRGVQGVANELDVHLPTNRLHTDSELASIALQAIATNVAVPKDRVKVTVSAGWVTLEGSVEWRFQSEAAEEAVRHLEGVRGVANRVAVASKPQAPDVRTKIEAALRRKAELDAKEIVVDAEDGTVTLSGHVRSWAEREDAVQAAWSAAGVRSVVDRIASRP